MKNKNKKETTIIADVIHWKLPDLYSLKQTNKQTVMVEKHNIVALLIGDILTLCSAVSARPAAEY